MKQRRITKSTSQIDHLSLKSMSPDTSRMKNQCRRSGLFQKIVLVNWQELDPLKLWENRSRYFVCTLGVLFYQCIPLFIFSIFTKFSSYFEKTSWQWKKGNWVPLILQTTSICCQMAHYMRFVFPNHCTVKICLHNKTYYRCICFIQHMSTLHSRSFPFKWTWSAEDVSESATSSRLSIVVKSLCCRWIFPKGPRFCFKNWQVSRHSSTSSLSDKVVVML